MTGRRHRTALAILLLAALILLPPDTARSQDAGEPDTDFRLLLSLRESPVPGIWADVRTTSLYPCAGYGLRFGVSSASDTLTLIIIGMVRPSPCIEVMDEASGQTYLAPPGDRVFFLRIVYRGETDLYRIQCTETGLRSASLRSRFTSLGIRHR